MSCGFNNCPSLRFMAITVSRNSTCGTQEFRQPSAFGAEGEFVLDDVDIVSMKRNGADVTTKGDDGKDVVKGFIGLFTDKAPNEPIFLTSIYRTRTGLDAQENLISVASKGTFVDKLHELTDNIEKPATLQRVVDTLKQLKGTRVRYQSVPYFARTTDGRVYEAHVRNYNIVK